MKKFTCEMCNSTDVVKQDGMLVCQSCGTKELLNDENNEKVDDLWS